MTNYDVTIFCLKDPSHMVCDVPFKIHPAMNFSSSGANMWFIEHFFCGGKELMISTRVFVVFLSNIIWASADTVNITRKI